jgi:Na+-translocating ferredoxin:NAD+ oxidoreductase RnfD subunit
MGALRDRIGGLAFAADDGDTAAEGRPTARELRRYMAGATLALAPLLVVAASVLSARVLAVFGAALAAGLAVELLVAHLRRRPNRRGALVVALLLALLLPGDLPLYLVAATAALGVLFGKEAFGGTGHNVFNPALVAKAFLVLSYPALVGGASFIAPADAQGAQVAVMTLVLAGTALLIFRAVDWRPAAAIFTGAGATLLVLGGLDLGAPVAIMPFLFGPRVLMGALVLAGDPATSPGTRGGRIACGLLIGMLAVAIRAFSQNADYVLYAVLLGNLAAPTIDAAALALRRSSIREVAA